MNVSESASEKTLAATAKRIITRGADDFTWIGSFRDQSLPGSHVFLVVAGGDVTGAFHSDDVSYALEPLGGGLHALMVVDRAQFAKCAVESEEATVGIETSDGVNDRRSSIESGTVESDTETLFKSTLSSKATLRTSAVSELKILVVYTPRAASESGNISSVAQGAVDALDDAFQNSGLPITATLVHHMQVTYTETGSQITAQARLEGKNDGYMDNVHLVRAQYHADIVALLNDEEDFNYGGYAGSIGASVSTAFVTVQWNRAIGEYVLAHEIGHLAGGRHQTNIDPATLPYEYGHGYVYSPHNWRTVQTVPQGAIPPIAYWSNPDKLFGGVAMGTATSEDMVRVWEYRGPAMAGWGESLVAPPSNLRITNQYSQGSLPQLAWNAVTTDPVQHYKVWRSETNGTWWTNIGTTTATSWIDSQVVIDYQNPTGDYMYAVTTIRTDNQSSDYSNRVSMLGRPFCGSCSLLVSGQEVPHAYALHPNSPNPFDASTILRYDLPEAADVELSVYNLLGQEVRRLVDGEVGAGFHTVTFEAGDLPSGVYLYRITAGDFSQTRRMVLTK